MLSVTCKLFSPSDIMLNVIMLSVVMLSVVAAFKYDVAVRNCTPKRPTILKIEKLPFYSQIHLLSYCNKLECLPLPP